MINLYTDKRYLDAEGLKVQIYDFEAFFIAEVPFKDFTAEFEEVMFEIDKAKVIDRGIGTIQTPFGVTSYERLSTGCKVILSYFYLRNNSYNNLVLDVTECGANALEVLFRYMERFNDSETKLLLRHKSFIHRCSSRDYLINGKTRVTSLSEIL